MQLPVRLDDDLCASSSNFSSERESCFAWRQASLRNSSAHGSVQGGSSSPWIRSLSSRIRSEYRDGANSSQTEGFLSTESTDLTSLLIGTYILGLVPESKVELSNAAGWHARSWWWIYRFWMLRKRLVQEQCRSVWVLVDHTRRENTRPLHPTSSGLSQYTMTSCMVPFW